MYRTALTQSLFPPQPDGEVLDTTVGGAFHAAVENSSDAIFLREVGVNGNTLRTWTYRRAGVDVDRLAQSLHDRFEPGERVVVCAPNIPEWVLLQLAVALAGLILVPTNPAFRQRELRYVVEQSRAACIFTCRCYRGNPLADTAARLCAEITHLREVFDLQNLDALCVPGGAGRSLRTVHPDSATQIQYTSGTTGLPKGAVISHRALTNNARFCFERLAIPQGSTLLHIMPLFHTGGCGFLLMGAMQKGLEVVLPSGFDSSIANEIVEQLAITVFLGVPTMLIGMLEKFRRAPRDFESLKLVLMGGASISSELVREVSDTFGCKVAVLYGQTEASSNMTCTWPQDTLEDIAHSVGQPLPLTEMAIKDPTSGGVLPIGTVGEICVRSYTRLIEYNDDPDATARAIDKDGWLHTGDLGKLDNRGYLSISGRLKDMIIRGGENIYPAEIEFLLARHPDIAETAVFGVPDAKFGEVVVCFVRMATGSLCNAEKLAAYCRQNLAPAKVPLHWRTVESWPLTASGKIQKFALRMSFLAEHEAGNKE